MIMRYLVLYVIHFRLNINPSQKLKAIIGCLLHLKFPISTFLTLIRIMRKVPNLVSDSLISIKIAFTYYMYKSTHACDRQNAFSMVFHKFNLYMSMRRSREKGEGGRGKGVPPLIYKINDRK